MWIRRSFTALFVSLCIYAIPGSSSAQSRINSSGNGGVHRIQGRIFTSNGRPVDTSISVRLESTTFGELTLVTDQSGGFAFTSLSPGTYTLVVNAGDNFEIVREYVTIDPQVQGNVPMRDQPRVFNVPIYLQLKRNTEQKPAVINAKLSDVPKDAIKHYEKGVALRQEGRSDEAVAEFKQAIGISPYLTPAYIEIGQIYLRSSRFDDAIASLRQAIRTDPENFDAKLNYGIALYGRGELAEAEKELKEAAELNKAAVTPHYYLGLLFIQRRNLDIAQSELETAKQLKGDRNFPLLHRYLGGIYVAKNMNKLAVTELETYISLDPKAKDADRIRQTISELRNKMN